MSCLTKVCPAHAPVTAPASKSNRIVLYLNAAPHDISSLCIMPKHGRPTHLQALRDVAVGARRVAAQVAFEKHAVRLVILHTRHEESVQAFKLKPLQYNILHHAYRSDGEALPLFGAP